MPSASVARVLGLGRIPVFCFPGLTRCLALHAVSLVGGHLHASLGHVPTRPVDLNPQPSLILRSNKLARPSRNRFSPGTYYLPGRYLFIAFP